MILDGFAAVHMINSTRPARHSSLAKIFTGSVRVLCERQSPQDPCVGSFESLTVNADWDGGRGRIALLRGVW